jgi:hypothetical protein
MEAHGSHSSANGHPRHRRPKVASGLCNCAGHAPNVRNWSVVREEECTYE